MENVLVFDLDGVITNERAYWIAGGLLLHELLYSPRYWNLGGASHYVPVSEPAESLSLSHATLPVDLIVKLKARAINSNLDTSYVGVSACLLDLLAQLGVRGGEGLWPLQPWDEQWIARFRSRLAEQGISALSDRAFARLDDPLLHELVGMKLIDGLNACASNLLGHPVVDLFGRHRPWWHFCTDLFQEWYLGDMLYAERVGREPVQAGKVGSIQMEEPLLPLEQLHAALGLLRERGYTLGIATGRPLSEAVDPLKRYGLYEYFDEQHIVMHDKVAQAEVELRLRGDQTSLVKPHPYVFLRAANPAYQPGDPLPARGSFVVVGDSTSDVHGARAANALMIAVRTGALTAEARKLLEESQPDYLVDDITSIPDLLARLDDLLYIQKLQFQERAKAELLVQRWLALNMDLRTSAVRLVPKAVSLNSFNGFYTIENPPDSAKAEKAQEFFFKTHVEELGIAQEYYHAEVMHQAGYNIVMPLRTIHQQGQQMVIYPVVHWPEMFNLMRAFETDGDTEGIEVEQAFAAERHECARLLDIYAETLAPSSAQEHANAPVHQLFWHRLAGERLPNFYAGKLVPWPDDREGGVPFEELLRYRWIVNGQPVKEAQGEMPTLGALIERGKTVLQPERALWSVIGHGDAHFGNVFLEEGRRYLYFDPAFAGRHSPLLDIVKPLFHNVFASWMYFGQEVARDLQLTVALRGETLSVEHNYRLPRSRQGILEIKQQQLLSPLFDSLRQRNALPPDWDEIVRLALMCCPLLTINMLERLPAAVCWLGLSQAMQLGGHGIEPWL